MKKYLIGSMAVIMAMAASGFTVINNKAAGDEYGQKSTGYVKLTSAYNSAQCAGSTNQCGYRVTESGASHVTDNFNATEAADYLEQGWIEPIDNSQGIYSGN